MYQDIKQSESDCIYYLSLENEVLRQEFLNTLSELRRASLAIYIVQNVISPAFRKFYKVKK